MGGAPRLRAGAAAAMAAGAVLGAGSGSVSLSVTSSLSSLRALRRFNCDLSIAELKGKLELVVGSPAAAMDLELYSPEEQLLARLDSDAASLASYPVTDGCRLHVIDRSGAPAGLFEDLSKVEKYEMPDSDYDQRSESLRSFLRQRRLGRFDVSRRPQQREQQQQLRAQDEARAAAIVPGGRCWVRLEGRPCHRATVAYVGETSFKPGLWVGLRCDDPVGRHDGSVGGRRYFECPPGYGVFVRPHCVLRGDWELEGGGGRRRGGGGRPGGRALRGGGHTPGGGGHTWRGGTHLGGRGGVTHLAGGGELRVSRASICCW